MFFSKKISWLRSLTTTIGLLTALLFVRPSVAYGQTTYYVANSGNDSNTGKSESSAIRTLSRVSNLKLEPGDQILFRRGDTFRGTLAIRQSGTSAQPIVVDAYGSGNKPSLAGSMPVTNWTNVGNNLWQATCSSCGNRVTGLYANGAGLPLGRYPNLDASNKGYLTIQSHEGKTRLTSQQSLGTNWTGGEAVVRSAQWILDRATITQQNGNTLTLSNNSGYDLADNWGYFIQNHPATLDQNGEWYYNPADKTFRLYSPNNPNDQAIQATTFDAAVSLTNVSYVTVRNLNITQAMSTNLLIDNSSNLVFTGNAITQAGEDGVKIKGSGSGILFENNLIENVNNTGFEISAYQNFTFRGNTVQHIGLWPGRGKSGDGTYVAVMSFCTDNTLIENNTVDDVGYNGINFSNHTTLRYNRVSNFCLRKSDGGGLYIWNGNKQSMDGIRVVSNIVYNGLGAPEGTPGGSYSGANGIYFDDCTQNFEVANNTVFNCKGLGIYLHASSSATVTGNTAFGNGEAQLAIIHNHGVCVMRSNVVKNNILVSKSPTTLVAKYESNLPDLAEMGQFDNNVYARPLDDGVKLIAVNNDVGIYMTLDEWKSRYGKDASSVSSPLTYSKSVNPDDYLKLVYNATSAETTVTVDGFYRDARNKTYDGRVTLAPYASVVLFKETSASQPATLRTPENPANAVTGLDYSYYEGAWNALPDFNSLTPAKTGTSSRIDLSVSERTNQFGLRFKGYVKVPADGTYTFYTATDDGSKLYIGTTEVVNNDGSHPTTEASGTIGLKAGTHVLTVTYFDGGGGKDLSVLYSGPGVSKQVIPQSALYRISSGNTTPPADPAPTANGTGLLGEYFNNKTLSAPTVLTRTDATINFSWSASPASGKVNSDNFSVRWSGQVLAPVSGSYRFSTTSDDGVRLWVNGVLLVDDWNEHGSTTNNGPAITLTAGQKYDLKLEYFENRSGAVVRLLWAYPNQSQQIVPQQWLFPASTPSNGGGGGTPTGEGVYLSDLTWTTVTNGYGPVEKDRSNGEMGGSDGQPIRLNGVTYTKGLGVHAPAEITYNLGGKYTRFVTDIGIDDEIGAGSCGTVVFKVYIDNVLVYTSDRMTPSSATQSISLDITGKQTLKLVADTGDDGNCGDHADWAGARLIGTGSARLAAPDAEVVPVRVYPNPAREEIRISYEARSNGDVAVELINLVAQSVLQTSHSVAEGPNLLQVPVQHLNRGVYVLTITQGSIRTTRKIILAE